MLKILLAAWQEISLCMLKIPLAGDLPSQALHFQACTVHQDVRLSSFLIRLSRVVDLKCPVIR